MIRIEKKTLNTSIQYRSPALAAKPVCPNGALVVDKNSVVRKLLCFALKNAGFRPRGAPNRKEALRRFKRELVEFALVDIVEGDEEEGLLTIRALRKLCPELKIVAMSAPGSGCWLNIAKSLGANGTLEKPFSGRVLLQTVHAVLEDTARRAS